MTDKQYPPSPLLAESNHPTTLRYRTELSNNKKSNSILSGRVFMAVSKGNMGYSNPAESAVLVHGRVAPRLKEAVEQRT